MGEGIYRVSQAAFLAAAVVVMALATPILWSLADAHPPPPLRPGPAARLRTLHRQVRQLEAELSAMIDEMDTEEQRP